MNLSLEITFGKFEHLTYLNASLNYIEFDFD